MLGNKYATRAWGLTFTRAKTNNIVMSQKKNEPQGLAQKVKNGEIQCCINR